MLADVDGEADINFPAGGNDSVTVEAAVGPHRDLFPGLAVAQPPHRLTQKVGGAGGGREQRVIATGAGIAVVARSFLGHAVGLVDG